MATLTVPVPTKATSRAISASSGIGPARVARGDREQLARAAVAQQEADRERQRE